MGIWSWSGIKPVVHKLAFVHPDAVLVGDVIVGENCYVGPGAVLRGDFGRITLEKGSNFQETCVAHAFPNKDVLVRVNGHIGHGAILHGCTVGKNAMIGMNAVVMDNAVIGENTIVGAQSFVKADSILPANSMVVGSPARVLRLLTHNEIRWKTQGTKVYQKLTRIAPSMLERVEPLLEPEPNRARVEAPSYVPLREERKKST